MYICIIPVHFYSYALTLLSIREHITPLLVYMYTSFLYHSTCTIILSQFYM